MEVDKVINLVNSGASISKERLKILKKFLMDNKKRDTIYILNGLMDELENITYDFINSQVINSVSTTIDTESINLNIYSGVNYDTEFDIASVTKLFTLVLVLKFIDNNIFNLDDKICDIDTNFKYLDYTILDLIKMSGSIITDSRIDLANNYNDALNRLYSVHPVNYDKYINNYTDIGFMVLSKLIEDITDNSFNDIIINFYKKYGIIINKLNDVVGNGYNDTLPHYPKARIMGTIGSAGIFINSNDMTLFAHKLFGDDNLIIKENLYKLSTKLFDCNHANKGYAGIYIKHPLGIKKSSTPLEYSRYAFSHQGYTGSCAIFDPLLKIHNSILVDSIKENKKKDKNFYKYFNEYHQKLVMITLKTYLLNRDEKVKMVKRI